MRPRRAREVVEAEPQDDRSTARRAGAQPPGDAGRRSRRPTSRSPRTTWDVGPALAATRSSAAGGRPARGRGSRLCASACRWRPDACPSRCTSSDSSSAATWPTVARPRVVQLRRGDPPDAPEPLDGERVEEPELVVGRDDEQAVGLGDAARHLREELRSRDADRDRQPDLARARAAAAGRRSRRACPASRSSPRTSRNASSIESPSTSGVVSSNTSKTALLASEYADIRGDDDDRVGAQPPRLPPAHRRPDAERLRLVARREHDAAADEHRPPAERAVVPLLDRGEERVEVGVEDRRRPTRTYVRTGRGAGQRTRAASSSPARGASLRGSASCCRFSNCAYASVASLVSRSTLDPVPRGRLVDRVAAPVRARPGSRARRPRRRRTARRPRRRSCASSRSGSGRSPRHGAAAPRPRRRARPPPRRRGSPPGRPPSGTSPSASPGRSICDVDPELGEVLVALEVAERAAPLDVVPARVAGVDDEPALARRDEPVLGLLQLGLRDHEPSLVSRASDG